MRRLKSPRILLALGLSAAWFGAAAIASSRSASAMATAANRFLQGLSPEQRQQQASFPWDSEERLRWHYIPTEQFPRKGVMIRDMTEPQRKLAHDLLKAGLSQRGYMTATAIMDLESVLRDIENTGGRTGRFVRDPEQYFFTVFGTPAAQGTWGWRVNGHHLSLHFDVANGAAVASTPSFFGTNPAQVLEGPKKGLRILGAEEDAARALLTSLDESQRKIAILEGAAPNEILTTNSVKVDPLSPAGIDAAGMTPKQRDLLIQLIEVYTSKMADDTASERLARLRTAGLEKIAFAWAGDTEPGPGHKHYYRIQGPTFLVEFDNTQNDGNHIHSVWRDFNGDFGRDLLREHVTALPH